MIGQHTTTSTHPSFPALVEPAADLQPRSVDDAISEARAVARKAGKDVLVWLTGPDHPWLASALAARGLRNEDSDALEAVETAMALMDDPDIHVAGVSVSIVDSLDAFAAGVDVGLAGFGATEEQQAKTRAMLTRLWDDYRAAPAYKRWNASLQGRVVGTAFGAFGPDGVNLFAGAVLPDARGHGVYRALVQARWEAGVERGTPALTVQAGRMSRPILERLGFAPIADMATYVDDQF